MAKHNYENSKNVLCYLPGQCFAVEEPTPIGECPHSYGEHCYKTAGEAEAAKFNATKGPLEPAVEMPTPIDQN